MANFLLSVPVKEFFKDRGQYGQDMDKRLASCFLTHGIMSNANVRYCPRAPQLRQKDGRKLF